MKKIISMSVLSICVCLAGCTNREMGTAVGATSGALLGGVIANGAGAAVGLAIGAGAGNLIGASADTAAK